MKYRCLLFATVISIFSQQHSIGQSEFVPPDQLRQNVERTYTDAMLETASYNDSSMRLDREPRSHLMDALLERLKDAQDPEIAIIYAQTGPSAKGETVEVPKKKPWYERIGVRGYTQFRYSFTLDDHEGEAPAQIVGDRSVGANQSFLLRRARLILFGDVTDDLFIYLQPDFASTPNGSVDAVQFAQIRDWYGDWYFDKEKVYRLRIGQSKVPYGWENMQSSSNRLVLDRADATNSAVRNERDLGLFFFWTPEYAQKFFKDVMDQGLKGSGNYGVVALGVYNGQGGSLVEQNHNVHSLGRVTLPMQLSNGQYVEVGVQGYTGYYVVYSSQIRANGTGPLIRPQGTLEAGDRRGWIDQRLAGTIVWYPQPIGFQSEWTIGRGPALNAAQTAIETRPLSGGYAQTMLKYDTTCYGIVFPFVRWSYYDGGYKSERNAPYSYINEWELGVEWQINPSIELVTICNITNRTNTVAQTAVGDISYQQFEGQLLRFQLQFNF